MIFLDLDGVMVDLVGCVLARAPDLLCLDAEETKRFPSRPEDIRHPDDLAAAVGGTETLTTLLDELWGQMEPYPFAGRLVAECRAMGDVAFLSCPASPRAWGGKAAWCARYFPGVPLILAQEKWRLSGPGCVLVDDMPEIHGRAWENNGGTFIIYPRPWNLPVMSEEYAMGMVLDQVRLACGNRGRVGRPCAPGS